VILRPSLVVIALTTVAALTISAHRAATVGAQSVVPPKTVPKATPSRVSPASVISPELVPAKVINDGYGDFAYVPAGAFRMGDTGGEGEARERPVHLVELDAFYIGRYEITNGDWRRFRDDPAYDDPKYWPQGRVVPKDQVPYWTQVNNHGGGTPDSDTYPVQGVNWDAAVAYCNWLSAKTGRTYRLPTEAEWEKAARGTDGRRYPWGNARSRTLSARSRTTPAALSATTTAAHAETSTRGPTRRRTARSIWQATSWSGATIGTTAATTPRLRGRIPKAPHRAPIVSCGAARSS
jgi:formylglycine-generating enzyme required for sulfatase activity